MSEATVASYTHILTVILAAALRGASFTIVSNMVFSVYAQGHFNNGDQDLNLSNTSLMVKLLLGCLMSFKIKRLSDSVH